MSDWQRMLENIWNKFQDTPYYKLKEGDAIANFGTGNTSQDKLTFNYLISQGFFSKTTKDSYELTSKSSNYFKPDEYPIDAKEIILEVIEKVNKEDINDNQKKETRNILNKILEHPITVQLISTVINECIKKRTGI